MALEILVLELMSDHYITMFYNVFCWDGFATGSAYEWSLGGYNLLVVWIISVLSIRDLPRPIDF